MSGRALPSFIFVAMFMAMVVPAAAQYSAAVKGACKRDYKRFCSAYAVDDPGLRRCIDKAGRSLSKTCVKALINSGEITKERAARRWKQNFD